MTTTYLATLADVGAGVPSGTSFPGSPSNGDLFFRTDLDLLCRYRSSGTRWVTVQLYEGNMIPVAAIPFSSTATAGRMPLWRTDFDIYLEKFYATYLVATTNTGSAFWTLEVGWLSAANAFTTLANVTSAAESPDVWNNESASIGAAINSGARALTFSVTKTSTPGAVHPFLRCTYRLIVT